MARNCKILLLFFSTKTHLPQFNVGFVNNDFLVSRGVHFPENLCAMQKDQPCFLKPTNTFPSKIVL